MSTANTVSPDTVSLDTGASKRATGFTDSTSGSSSSAERYQLDEFDTSPILLYQYRGGLETSSQKDICARLDKDESLRVTKKPIPRYATYVEVKRQDLFLQSEKEEFRSYPTFDLSLASIKIPTLAYFSRLFFGNYQDLYIVSHESSPTSSVASADSRRTSPTFWHPPPA